MELSASTAQRVPRTMRQNRGAIFSKHQSPLFSKGGATRFCRRSISLRSHGNFGCSTSAEHGICPQRVLSSNCSALISRDPTAKNKGRNDCASGRIRAESFLDGRAAPSRCSEKTKASHHDHCCLRARFDSGDDCNLTIETGSAERGSLYCLDRYSQTRSNGASGARAWHAFAGGHSLDSCKYGRSRGENKYLAGHAR